MSTVKSKKLQVGTDATSSNNFTIYQPSTPDGTLRIGVGNADSPTEVGQFNANGYKHTETIPSFFAYNTSVQSISANTWTKITYPTASLNNGGSYDTSNSRFTPNIAGWYFISSRFGFQPYTTGYNINQLQKNGGGFARGGMQNPNGNYGGITGTWIVYLNGTTDYVEIYCNSSGAFNTEAGSAITWWQGHLVQQA